MENMSSSSKNPEFFTVFLPEYCSDQLKICSSFKTHLRREEGGEACIKRFGIQKIWKVELVKEESQEFWFKNGWKEFVLDNNLTIGEFMVFQYYGKTRFSVQIYGTNGLERLIAPGTQELLVNNSRVDEDGVDGHDADEEMLVSSGRRRGGSVMEKRKEGVRAAKKCMMDVNNPSFTVCMTQSYLSIGTMHLPNAFVNQYMEANVSHLTVQIAEKTWCVKLCRYQNSKTRITYYKLGEGFGGFLLDNDVQVGDFCVFEAADFPCTTLKVSILRINI